MKKWGIILLVFGVGSFILPFFGLQFRLLSLFGEATPIVGAILAIVGVILLVLPLGMKKEEVRQ